MTDERDGLDQLAALVSELVALDPAGLAEGERVVVLNRCLAQLEAVTARAAARFEDSRAYATEGAQSAPSWIARNCRLPLGVARRQVRLGRAMGELALVSAAWLSGEITAAQVTTLSGLAHGRCGEALVRDEPVLVEQAKKLSFEDFQRAMQYFEQLADEDGSDEREEKRRTRRDVTLSQSLSGVWLGHITLDPVSGEIVSSQLEAIEHELYAADRAEARRRLGREPLTSELSRTLSQRRADALVEMATRSASAPEDGARPAPLFTVLVGYETLQGRISELGSGTVISPGALISYLDQALIERAVFGPARRVEIGARRRLFDGATRRAIEVRDRRCVHPYCDKLASDCQVDHTVPFDEGGLTTQENGRLLCAWHNRLAWRQWQQLDEATRAELVARQRQAYEEGEHDPEPDEGAQDPDRGPPAEAEPAGP